MSMIWIGGNEVQDFLGQWESPVKGTCLRYVASSVSDNHNSCHLLSSYYVPRIILCILHTLSWNHNACYEVATMITFILHLN